MYINHRRHLLLSVLLALVLWFSWPHLLLLEQGLRGKALPRAHLDAAFTSIGYVLDRERWTRFPVNPALQTIKVLSNATIPIQASSETADVEWAYAIEFQFLDAKGDVIRDHVNYYRSRVTWYQDERFAEPVTSSFYVDPAIQPTDGRMSMISLRGLSAARSVRVRVATMDPGIRDLVLRLYEPEQVPQHKLAVTWNHLSVEQKRALAKGNVYDYDLLSEVERKNLVRRHWVGIGPVGVAGQHYVTRKIYTFRKIQGEALAPPVAPFGVYVSSSRHGVIPVPAQGGRLRLVFSAVNEWRSHDKPQVLLRWTDPGGRVSREYTVPWLAMQTVFEQHFDGGTIEIISPREGAVRSYLLQEDGSPQEITPEYPYLAVYMASRIAVEYGVNHVEGAPTVMRFDLRSVRLQGAPVACDGADYALLDGEGKVIRHGRMTVSVEPSLYDMMTGRWSDSLVSDPIRHYLWLPANVHRVRFSSVCPISVNAYDRPHGFIWTTQVPDDYKTAKRLDLRKRIPGWFSVRPMNLKELLVHNRIPLVQVQIHPRQQQDIEQLMAGIYHWQDYLPQNRQRARWLLVPRESPLPPRKQSLAGFYMRLAGGDVRTIHMDSETGSMRPNLIFMRSEGRAEHIRLWLDDHLYYETDIAGRLGELRLPRMQAGTHRIRLQASADTQVYISYADAIEGVYIKRMVHPLGRQSLRFVVDKRPEEHNKVLSARLFMPVGLQQPTKVRVSIHGVQRHLLDELAGWTFTERMFVLHAPQNSDRVPVLGKAGQYMNVGQSFFIPLRDDLPPGSYTVEFSVEGEQAGYIALTNVVPGQYEDRQIIQEAVDHEFSFQ